MSKQILQPRVPHQHRTATLLCFAVALVLYSIWAFTTQHQQHGWHYSPHYNEASSSRYVPDVSYLVQRPNAIIHLESQLDSHPRLGSCYQGHPQLPGLTDSACKPLHCLWSDRVGANVDIWLHAFTLVPASLLHNRCAAPAGGQAGTDGAVPPEVSFVLLVPSAQHSHEASQAILELFRASREVPSAEYVVLLGSAAGSWGSPSSSRSRHSRSLAAGTARSARSAFGSASSAQMASTTAAYKEISQTLTYVQQLFGVRVKLVYTDLLLQPRLDQTSALRSPAATWTAAAGQAALAQSAGTYVMLVTSGTLVTPGTVHALRETLRSRLTAVLATPLLLGPGGQVAAAGGMIGPDGSLSFEGANSLLGAFQADYAQEVDAALLDGAMLPRALHLQHGPALMSALDQAGAAGYGMQARALNLSVVYQPAAVVFRADAMDNVQALAEHHRSMQVQLLQQWQHVIRGAAPRRRLLWVDEGVPEPDKDSGSLRGAWLLRVLLAHHYAVTFLPHVARPERYAQQLRFHGVRVLPPTQPDQMVLKHSSSAASATGVTNGTGATASSSSSGAGSGCLYDGYILSRPDVFQAYAPAIRAACPSAPLLYDTVDVHFLREARAALSQAAQGAAVWNPSSVQPAAIKEWLAQLDATTAAARARHEQEIALMRGSNVTLVVSKAEQELVLHYCPDCKVVLVSNVHDTAASSQQHHHPPCSARSGVLFVGSMAHQPNQQAIRHLLRDVLPHIQALLPPELAPKFKVHIVGGSTEVPPDLAQLFAANAAHLLYHGWLSDEMLGLLYSRVKVVVAPLLSGAGVKGKVNQAMKFGVPVVATSLAVEGMHVIDGQECLVADDPRAFAARVVQLYRDCGLWGRLVDAGCSSLDRHFSVGVVGAQLLAALRMVGLH